MRPFFEWRSTTFLLSQWVIMLSVVILTVPWIVASPEEMKKDTVGWLCLDSKLIPMLRRWEDGCQIRAKTEISTSPNHL